ncbi:MAG: glycosyltransferase [Anaerolineae bacterium]|nr:glycosyltransferase [Anaerolineae bacterium]NIN94270.1 glycosyltransferase [Anaerolineae bacterium]NIQ77338.1 glycosyltransferase [Anaerolineae bacterium]
MKISVYITSYNQKHYLTEAVESVLNQTLKPTQIVIVDDCSTDGSQEVIAGYASQYGELMTPVYHTSNQGVAHTRTDGVRAATGDYVTHVDGDDRFLPTKLEKEANLLRRSRDVQIAFSNYYYVRSDGSQAGLWADGEKPPEGDVFCRIFARDFPRRSLFRNELVDRRAWEHIGFYDPQLSLYEDYEMLIRLTKHLRVAYCEEPLSEYRIHHAGLSRARAVEHLAALDYIYQKNKPLLEDVTPAARVEVERKLRQWMARMAKRAAHEAVEDAQQFGGRRQALRKYLQIVRSQPLYTLDYRLMLRMLLPYDAYESLRTASRKARRYARSVRN